MRTEEAKAVGARRKSDRCAVVNAELLYTMVAILGDEDGEAVARHASWAEDLAGPYTARTDLERPAACLSKHENVAAGTGEDNAVVVAEADDGRDEVWLSMKMECVHLVF